MRRKRTMDETEKNWKRRKKEAESGIGWERKRKQIKKETEDGVN